MFVFCASVHHTGTNFVSKLFTDLGYEFTDKTPKEAGNSVNYFHRCHIGDSTATELGEWLNVDVPLIVPLRHPIEVAKSWLARDKPIERMVRQFQILNERVDCHNPLYLPIDHPYREQYFNYLRLATDLELSTEWPVIASKREGSTHRAQLTVPEPSAADIKLLVALAHTPLLNKFYPEPWEFWQ